MKKIILLVFTISSPFVLAQSPDWSWVKKSTGDINEAFACVTTDSNGNVFAGGSFISDTADFGLGTVTTNGYADYSIIKYDGSGTPLWMKNGGGTGNEVTYNLTTDASGNLYAAISFQSASVTFGSFVVNNRGTVLGAGGLLPYDVALVKYDTNGTVLWAKNIGGPEEEYSATVSCDASGNVYITTLSVSQTLYVGSSSISASIPNGVVGSVLAKFDAQGNTLWIKRFGSDIPSEGASLAAPVFDASGNSYLTGSFTSETFTLGAVTYANVTPGATEAFIVQLDPNGTILGQNALQGSVDDAFGNVLIIQNELFVPFSVSLFPSTSSATYSYDGVNYNTTTTISGFIKIDQSLHLISIINAPITGRMVSDGTNIYMTGGFSSPTKTFGATTLTNTNTSTVLPTNDIFVAKMNTSGQFLWAKSAGGIGNDDMLGFAIDPTGNLFVAGYFGSFSCAFGNTSITNTSQGDYADAYVAKLNSTSLSNSNFEKEKVVLYPNPTKDFITIYTNEAIEKTTISDVNGRILDVQFESTVNLSNLTTGIYFLNVKTETGIVSKKIIKQ